MAAASSIHTSSACPSLWQSAGWMYWEVSSGRVRGSLDRDTYPRAHLDGLTMLVEDVHSDHSLPKLRVSRLDGLIVLMLGVAQGIKPSEHKLKEGVQVFRARGCHKDIRVANGRMIQHLYIHPHQFLLRLQVHSPKCHSCCNGQTKGCRLASPSGCGQGYSIAECFLRNGFYKLQYCLCLQDRDGCGAWQGSASGNTKETTYGLHTETKGSTQFKNQRPEAVVFRVKRGRY